MRHSAQTLHIWLQVSFSIRSDMLSCVLVSATTDDHVEDARWATAKSSTDEQRRQITALDYGTSARARQCGSTTDIIARQRAAR
jgi:hypothetical protein